MTRDTRVGGIPDPVQAPPAVADEDVTKGYVPWSTSSRVACPASSRTFLPSLSALSSTRRGVGDHGGEPRGIRKQFLDDLRSPS